ncbi:Y-family DNA polymerase [Pedomonas sp. V897]|uniref:Y-family DNA polymerase n=1 Tax=Pedomonas sp. V897 TaxID=3446482 RepID=UPI003EE38C10
MVSLWLPHWPLERRRQALRRRSRLQPGSAGPDAEPREFALVEAGPHGLSLAALNEGARAAGLRVGQMLTDARAWCPSLAAAPIDREADAAALAALARWAGQYTPIVGVDGRDGLLLDVTGCAHLRGGEHGLLADLARRLHALGFTARLALADTVGCAWALARFGADDQTVVPEGAARLALADLPVAALRLEPEVVAALRLLGLKRIGQLLPLPRAALARRFRARQHAEAVVTRLDQALGDRGEPVTPLDPPALLQVTRSFGAPLIDRALVEAWLPRLLTELTALLARQGLGVRRLQLTAFRTDGARQDIVAGMGEPTRDAAHIARLLAPRLEALDPGFGIESLRLAAVEAAPLAAVQDSFAGDRGALDLARLGDRLANRLGERAVYRLAARESHVPERAEALRPRARGPRERPAHRAALDLDRPRPLLLLDRPEAVSVVAEVPEGPPARFVWRRLEYRVVRAIGPERIAPEWWQAQDGERTRDYYVVEDAQGRRFWLFRHGLYGGAAHEAPAAPDWFIHGFFG